MSCFCRFPFRRLAPLLIVLGVASMILGSACGGGGGSSGGNGNTNGTNNGSTGVGFPQAIAAQAVFVGTETPASGEGVNSSPYSLVHGDQVQVQLWGINSVTQQPQQVPASSFSFGSPAPNLNVATLSSSGVLTAIGTSNGTFTVNATYAGGSGYSGGTASFLFQVVSPGAKVSGVARDSNQTLVQGVIIHFYNSSGLDVMDTLTGANGTFLANVPTSATTFVADASALTGCLAESPSAPCYFNEYGYGSLYYSTVSPSCYTPVPALTAGRTTSLPNQVVMLPSTDSSSPPPPPTGCQG